MDFTDESDSVSLFLLTKINGGGDSVLFLLQPYSCLKNPSFRFICFFYRIFKSSFNESILFLPFPLCNGATSFSLFKQYPSCMSSRQLSGENLMRGLQDFLLPAGKSHILQSGFGIIKRNIRHLDLLWFHSICK